MIAAPASFAAELSPCKRTHIGAQFKAEYFREISAYFGQTTARHDDHVACRLSHLASRFECLKVLETAQRRGARPSTNHSATHPLSCADPVQVAIALCVHFTESTHCLFQGGTGPVWLAMSRVDSRKGTCPPREYLSPPTETGVFKREKNDADGLC